MEVWKSLNVEDYCLKDLFEETECVRNTRSSGTKKLKTNFKSKIRESSFHYQSVRLWNSAPLEIINAETPSKAKKAIREYVLTLPIWKFHDMVKLFLQCDHQKFRKLRGFTVLIVIIFIHCSHDKKKYFVYLFEMLKYTHTHTHTLYRCPPPLYFSFSASSW